MLSPITKKKMNISHEKREMEFRGEPYEILFHFYKCDDSGEQYTNDELDEINIRQVHNQYRVKYNIPFQDEIKSLRDRYGISASKMSEILGMGVNSYRRYENGVMPSAANGKLINLIKSPHIFYKTMQSCTTIDDNYKRKYLKRIKKEVEKRKLEYSNRRLQKYLFGNHKADIYSGYKIVNPEVFTEMIKYFAETVEPYKTMMNKLLFYADFKMFKKSCFSISGMRYHAIPMGPVPNNFQSIYEYLENMHQIMVENVDFGDGVYGEHFLPKQSFKKEIFSVEEYKVLESVVEKFRTWSTRDIVKYSHREKAWKENEKEKAPINYEYGFLMENGKKDI